MNEPEPKSNKYILLIMSCHRYKFKADLQRKTWLKTIPSNLPYYHVVGDENLETDYHFNEKERILTVKVKDDYNSLPKKVISAYEAIFKEFEFQYVFKTDDDQRLENPKKFFEVIYSLIKMRMRNPTTKSHYGGNPVEVPQRYLSQYHKIHPELPKYLPVYETTYCSGRFYYLSYEAIGYLLNMKEKIKNEYLEDYAIGYYLHKYFKTNLMKIQSDHYFTDFTEDEFKSADDEFENVVKNDDGWLVYSKKDGVCLNPP